ncbi:MAG: Ldh family oxidoreductase [Verrucomicrobia bacterium]|nr:Ldh family oxidoreductase [Verrucomicrobiota bacterium]MCG2679237.1 Ldh family oxidoreductase [Kiritimatiellia bacterium]MBU4248631.1 Ldh family oxidoreductase [Verrucomicrobiota bacterium]MBU4290092.1 Ldh family oxidoreductase [Verrucomicrobiota bacterium]MBU4429790.1 Ldh family oxidoreductase [Verrucomicrobiota bacterium]
MKCISMKALIHFGVAFMTKRGMPKSTARYLAQVIVETEAFRQSTHGLIQFKVIHDALGKDVDPQAKPKVVKNHGAMALLDGNHCLGGITMKTAVDLAARKARQHGIGFVAVRNTTWVGALGIYLIPLARAGFMAEAWAQTNTCKDCAPYGGIDPRFSTNPMAVAFPADPHPMLADFSTATMSMAAAHALEKAGKKTSPARFLDGSGKPSPNPAVLSHGGTLMFGGGEIEGHKFYALSLFIEALTVLAGGSANNPHALSRQSLALMVLDPAAFAGTAYYVKEMKRFIKHVKSSRVRPGCDSIRLPGERGFAAMADCRVHGIPLSSDKLRMLRQIAADNGIEPVG